MILSVRRVKVNFLLFFFVVYLPHVFSGNASADGGAVASPDQQSQAAAVKCTGKFYRAKKDGVLVYDLPDTTGRVLKRLEVGEEVCYLGEKDSFAIIDWPGKQAEGSEGTDNSGETQTLAYVRSIELRDPDFQRRPALNSSGSGLFETIKRYFYYMKSGGVPDDGLAPYRPLINDIVPDSGSDLGKCSIDSCEDKQSESNVPESKSLKSENNKVIGNSRAK